MRITLGLDDPVLRELKRLQEKAGKSPGRLVSDLPAQALKVNATPTVSSPPVWFAKPMGARVKLANKDAVYRALDR